MSKTFFTNWGKLREENNAFKIISFGLTMALIVSSVANYKLYQEKTVVIVPPKISKDFRVSGNEISHEYFEQISFYLADRILSVSPETVSGSFYSVLPFLTTNPNALKLVREAMAEQAQVIKENDIYQVFYPMRMMLNEKAQKVSVEGMLKKMSGNNSISAAKTTITFDFVVSSGGQLTIKSMEVK